MLYLISTPIGNLDDLSFRALNTLKQVDYLLCEDTRHSQRLLKYYEVNQRLVSYHKFNEASRWKSILKDLQEGKDIGLISDAGTPGIQDPGNTLVSLCHQHNIQVSAIPGPCAIIHALTSSGLHNDAFCFLGFVSKKSSEMKKCFFQAYLSQIPCIFFDTPHKIQKTLAYLSASMPQATLVIGRELSKKFEQIQVGTCQEIFEYWKEKTFKGELVIILYNQAEKETVETMNPKELVLKIEKDFSIEKKQAIKIAAEMCYLPKRVLYKSLYS